MTSRPEGASVRLLSAVFVLTFLIYFLPATYTGGGDSTWVLPTALSLIHDGDVELSEYEGNIDLSSRYAVVTIDEGLYNYFPLGTSILIVPPLLMIEPFLEQAFPPMDLYQRSQHEHLWGVDLMMASLAAAAGATMLFGIGAGQVGRRWALAVWATVAFGTAMWSIASRTLWMHGPLVFVLAIALYALLKARHRRAWLVLAGIGAGFAFFVRPSAAIWVVLIGIYVVYTYRRRSAFYFVGVALVALPFVLHYLTVYDALLPPYYRASRLVIHADYGEAVAANLISPARGLFFYSPVLLFALVGAVLKVRAREWRALDTMIVAGMVLHVLTIAAYLHWWAGWSNGPRLMIDVLPFLALFMIYYFQRLRAFSPRVRTAHLAAYVPLLGLSIFIHYSSAVYEEVREWDALPISVDLMPSRVWDWTDPSFLRPYRDFDDISPLARTSAHRLECDDTDGILNAMGGWKFSERTSDSRDFAWMTQPTVRFYLPMTTEAPLRISIDVLDAIDQYLMETLTLTVNDRPIELTVVARHGNERIFVGFIPPQVLSSRSTYTEFELSIARTYSPSLLGLGHDPMPIGLAVDFIQIGRKGDNLPRTTNLPEVVVDLPW